GMIAAQSGSSFIPNVIALPENIEGKTAFKRTVFTNKGFAYTSSKSDRCIIGLSKNSFGVHENDVTSKVETMTFELNEDRVTVTNQTTADGKATIADADIVVSAGRGLKGPENWHLVEDLAEVLGAATACSKPVSDLGWRPHSEHVGQTGKPVATNLYIAIGISGAIQHLAGINASKVKVVINNDPEAPFFKAADYGIVGDAFTVVPQLIEKLKVFKAQNA
ncbi:MAG: electron transfer flavoprotein subunit alpha/FixB family protein, partial [Flavobacteriaceae bacterium]